MGHRREASFHLVKGLKVRSDKSSNTGSRGFPLLGLSGKPSVQPLARCLWNGRLMAEGEGECKGEFEIASLSQFLTAL